MSGTNNFRLRPDQVDAVPRATPTRVEESDTRLASPDFATRDEEEVEGGAIEEGNDTVRLVLLVAGENTREDVAEVGLANGLLIVESDRGVVVPIDSNGGIGMRSADSSFVSCFVRLATLSDTDAAFVIVDFRLRRMGVAETDDDADDGDGNDDLPLLEFDRVGGVELESDDAERGNEGRAFDA